MLPVVVRNLPNPLYVSVCVCNAIFFGLLVAKSFSEKLGNIFCHDTCTLFGISLICVVCVHNTGNDYKQIA